MPDGGMCYKCNGSGNIIKDVRMYEDAELERMERASKKALDKRRAEADERAKQHQKAYNANLLRMYGFESDEAYLVIGDSFKIKDKLKEHGAKYTQELHWVCPTEPTWLPAADYAKITVSNIFVINEHGTYSMRDDYIIFMDSLKPVRGEFVGQVGHKIRITAKLIRITSFESTFGYYPTMINMHVFETTNKETLIWKTETKCLDVETMYVIEGTVKEHSFYNNVKQTVLTRCKVKEQHDT